MCGSGAVSDAGLYVNTSMSTQIQFASTHVLERSAHGAPGLTNDVGQLLAFNLRSGMT
jgi:hypothetical protein